MQVEGNIPFIVNNYEGFYNGDLRHYLRVIFKAPNIHNPYHGLRHMLHVLYVSYEGCRFHSLELSKREVRNTLIAAMFHDYGHRGVKGDDEINIEIAIAGLRERILEEDLPYLDEIIRIIRSTKFPHDDLGDEFTLEQRILRDADICGSLSPAWIGMILGGFSKEWDEDILDVLEMQIEFHQNMKFESRFGQTVFNEDVINLKVLEIKRLQAILTE